MSKKIALTVMILLGLTPFSFAEYPSSVVVLDKPDIVKMTDDQLVDTYENVIVEIEANRTFHATSGFSPKEYKDFKALLKFRLLLSAEIHSRNLEVPSF